jgi:hypothetical protein
VPRYRSALRSGHATLEAESEKIWLLFFMTRLEPATLSFGDLKAM